MYKIIRSTVIGGLLLALLLLMTIGGGPVYQKLDNGTVVNCDSLIQATANQFTANTAAGDHGTTGATDIKTAYIKLPIAQNERHRLSHNETELVTYVIRNVSREINYPLDWELWFDNDSTVIGLKINKSGHLIDIAYTDPLGSVFI